MAMSAVYTNFGGKMVHEKRGATYHRYASDPLGSLAAVFVSGEDSPPAYAAEYWPYGEIQTETGANPSPWGFVGLLGYFKDLATLLYIRARHYLTQKARWLTVDPLWPNESAYGYVMGRVAHLSDPMGLNVMPSPGHPPCPPGCSPSTNQCIYSYCNRCYRAPWHGCQSLCSSMAWDYYRCKGKPPTRRPFPFFAPPPGGGEVAPIPPGLPLPKPVKPCWTVPESDKPYWTVPVDCGPSARECVNAMIVNTGGSGAISISRASGMNCCNRIPASPECNHKWQECVDAVNDTIWGLVTPWVNQFGGPSGKGFYD